MEAFLTSTGIVALAEIGDKTQLLTFLLAAKFRKPAPIIAGILIATLANHALAAAVGSWITSIIDAEILHWLLGISFIGMAIWLLIPDKLDIGDAKLATFGVFTTTLLSFFLAEMGDKTQIATVALAAQYKTYLPVVAGTTLGMAIANAPAALFGERIARHLPTRLLHSMAALIFAILGIIILQGIIEL